jgi:hypothetical protein
VVPHKQAIRKPCIGRDARDRGINRDVYSSIRTSKRAPKPIIPRDGAPIGKALGVLPMAAGGRKGRRIVLRLLAVGAYVVSVDDKAS